MERIRQDGAVLSQHEFKKGTDAAVCKFLFSKEDSFHCRIEGPSITFWRSGESAPFGGWRFSSDSRIVDACSLAFIDGSDGVVIAVNGSDGKKAVHFLAYFSFKKSSVLKMISIKNEITCIEVLIDNLSKSQIMQLNQGLQNAPHWIAVGTAGGSCYLTHFGIDTPSDIDLHVVPPSFSTNVTKSYISDDAFIVDTGQSKFAVKLDAVSVTALCYVPKCWLLLIGLSCGAVIAVGLSKTPTRMMYYMYDGPVRSFAWQEPNDDPRPTFYLWIAFDESQRRRAKASRICGAQVILAIIVFPEDEGKPFSEWSYLSPRIQRHFSWSPGVISRWVSFRTIVQNDSGDRVARHVDRSSMLDESALNSSSPDSTLLLMIWINQKGTAAEGALFDLNALYYKRLIKSVIFDETVAHQCPFLSLFTLLEDRQLVSDIQDVVACSDTFLRFSGPLSESNDALFYPSALSFTVAVLKTNSHLFVEIRSIQDKLLHTIESDIVDAVGANVNLAAQWMTAVGLADANSTFAANTEWYEPSLVITGLLNHGFASGLKKWLEDSADEASRDDFNKFLWDFVQDTKEHFDENSSGLFARISMAPPKWTVSWLKSAYFVFKVSEELFATLHKKLSSGLKKLEAEIECHRRASSNLALYTRFVLFMLRFGVLPESTNYGSIWAQVREKVDERHNQAEVFGKQLFIHELLEEMKRVGEGEGEGFWVGENLTSLYPPKTLLALLAPILALNITLTAKLKLMGYFFLDYDLVTKREVFQRYRNVFLSNDQYLAEQIVARHEADCSGPVKPSTDLYKELCDLRKRSVLSVKELLTYPLLDEAQYAAIRDALLKKEDGITEWNNFCIGRRQLQRLIEPTKEVKNEQWKNECDQWTRRFLREIPRIKLDQPVPSVFAKWTSTEEVELPKEFMYVNKRRPRRRTTLHETLVEYKSTMELRKRKAEPAEVTPERKRSQQVENISVWSNNEVSPVGDTDAVQLEKVLPKENLERVRRILQTPPSARRLGRNIRGTLPLDFDSTPESVATVQPTSILKSGAKRRLHRDSEPGLQRLRFDLPSADLESSVASTTEGGMPEEETVVETEEDVIEEDDEALAESYTIPSTEESLPDEEMVVEPGDSNVAKEDDAQKESYTIPSPEESRPEEEPGFEPGDGNIGKEEETQKESSVASTAEECLPEDEAVAGTEEDNIEEEAEALAERCTTPLTEECLPDEKVVAEPGDSNVAKEGEAQRESFVASTVEASLPEEEVVAAIEEGASTAAECLPEKEAVAATGEGASTAEECLPEEEAVAATVEGASTAEECLPEEEAVAVTDEGSIEEEAEASSESSNIPSAEECLPDEQMVVEPGDSNIAKEEEVQKESSVASAIEKRLELKERTDEASGSSSVGVAEMREEDTVVRRLRSASRSPTRTARKEVLAKQETPRRRGTSRSPSRAGTTEPAAEKKTPRSRGTALRNATLDFASDVPKRTRAASVTSVTSAPEKTPRKRGAASRSPSKTPSKSVRRAASEAPSGSVGAPVSRSRGRIRAGRNVVTSEVEVHREVKRRILETSESSAVEVAESLEEETIARRLRSASRSPTRTTAREEILAKQDTSRRRSSSRSPSRAGTAESAAEKKTPRRRGAAVRDAVLDFAPEEPERTREASVTSVASAPEKTPQKRDARPRSPSRASKRSQRAASEAPSGSVGTPVGGRGRGRIRAGRKRIEEVLETIEEERKNTPTRSSSRSRKTPSRYGQ